MFDQFLFNPSEDGKYHLVCPTCKKQDPEPISGEMLSVLQWRGECSTCIECDESAVEMIPYWPAGQEKSFPWLLASKIEDMPLGERVFVAGFIRGVLFARGKKLATQDT